MKTYLQVILSIFITISMAKAETLTTNILSKKEIEKKYNLPPEPNKNMAGFDTIEGIDSNGIRGRDDVERILAFTFYKDESILNEMFKYSEDIQSLTVISLNIKNGKGGKESYRKLYHDILQKQICNITKNNKSTYINIEYLRDIIFNTDERYLNNYISEEYAQPVKVDSSKCHFSNSKLENTFNLPPEPSEEDTLATLEGVDVDEDGIRDDLKRLITFEFPNDPYARKVYERRAAIWTELLKNEGNLEKQQELIKENGMIIICQRRGYIPTTKKIDSLGDYITIGANREIYEQKLIKKLSFSIPSAAESKQYCESFK